MRRRTPPFAPSYLTTLADKVHELDPTRLVTAALLIRTEGNTKIVDDPLGKALDVIGTNEYIGWYEKTPEDIANHHLVDRLRQAADHQRVRRRGQGRSAWQRTHPLDRGVSGQPLPQPDHYAEQDPAAARHQSLDSDGLPLSGATSSRNSGRVQPQGAHLRSGAEEGGVLHLAEGLQRQTLGKAE